MIFDYFSRIAVQYFSNILEYIKHNALYIPKYVLTIESKANRQFNKSRLKNWSEIIVANGQMVGK